jgi:hypothetical protein
MTDGQYQRCGLVGQKRPHGGDMYENKCLETDLRPSNRWKNKEHYEKARTPSTADSIQTSVRVNVVNAIMMRSHQLDKPEFVTDTG